jgi:prepilin-type N-terminal cleavage/methylation domain-containing protein
VCREGFTLVEILATLTLAAIVLPPVVQGISLSLATSIRARQQAQAASLAQCKL